MTRTKLLGAFPQRRVAGVNERLIVVVALGGIAALLALGVVVFPALSRELARGEHGAYTALLVRSLRLILFAMLPLTGLGIVLRGEIVTLLFGYGRFDAAAIELTAGTLLVFLLGLAGQFRGVFYYFRLPDALRLGLALLAACERPPATTPPRRPASRPARSSRSATRAPA